jgi:MinD superfamily P-loop ATPase
MGKSYGVIINRAGLGDEGVYNYLEKEKITLLMSIPFDRKIASVYSNGKLLTNELPEWKAKFRELLSLITAQLWK